MKNRNIYLFSGLALMIILGLIVFGVLQTSYPPKQDCKKVSGINLFSVTTGETFKLGNAYDQFSEVAYRIKYYDVPFYEAYNLITCISKGSSIYDTYDSGVNSGEFYFKVPSSSRRCWNIQATHYFCPDCYNPKCYGGVDGKRYFDCVDNEWVDRGYVIGKCDVECKSDSECGTKTYEDKFCKNNNVYINTKNPDCDDYECSTRSSSELYETCEFGCMNGLCVQGECSFDSDCEQDNFIGNTYCKEDSVYQIFKDYSCSSNSCVSAEEERLKQECEFGCLDGACLGGCSENDIIKQGESYLICQDGKYNPIVDILELSEAEQQKLLDKIATLEKTIEDKAQVIENLTTNLEGQAKAISDLRITIDEKALLIQELQDTKEKQILLIKELNLEIDKNIEIIKDLEFTIEGQAEIILNYEATIEQQAEYINQLADNIEEKTRLIGLLRDENEEQAELIKAMKLSFSEQADIINGLEKTIEDDAEIIDNLELTNKELGELIKELNRTIDQKAELINQFKTSLIRKGEIISELELTLEQERQIIESYELELEEQAEIIAGLNRSLEEERQLVEELRDKIEEQQELLNNIENYRTSNILYYLLGLSGFIIALLILVIYKRFRRK